MRIASRISGAAKKLGASGRTAAIREPVQCGLVALNCPPTRTARGIGRTLVCFSSVRRFEPHPTSRFQAVSMSTSAPSAFPR
jgi:hypothetical protein